MVLGPKKLPGAAAQIGRWLGRARVMARQFREQLELEVSSVDKALDTNVVHKAPAKPAASPAQASSPAPAPAASAPPSQTAPPPAESSPESPWYAPFGGEPGLGMEPAESKAAVSSAAQSVPEPVAQPHPESSMIVRPVPPREPQAELPFGEAPSSPGGASHSRSD